MKTSWNQMIVLGSAALFFTAYAPQSAMAQEQAVPQGKAPSNSTDVMESLVPEESTLTPEEEIELRVDEGYVFDEQVPG